MSKPENPPLFEYEYDGQNNVLHSSAITLRDLFAAAAVVAIVSDPRFDHAPEDYARRSFALADAMLAAREKRDAE